MENNKVVRIDKLMYSTPEKAFKDVNLDDIFPLIRKITTSTNKIIEADIFRMTINLELNLSYSKYFYASLIGVNIKELGLYRSNNLISAVPIKLKSIQDICRFTCQTNHNNNENIKKMREIIWITDSVASSTLHQWKQLLKQDNKVFLISQEAN
jgi:hypothetical protein